MKRRPQFTLRALLVAMLVVAAFLGGMATNERLAQLKLERAKREASLATRSPGLSVGQRLRASAKRNAAIIELQRRTASK